MTATSIAPTPPPTSGIESGTQLNNDFAWEAEHFPRPLPEGFSYPTLHEVDDSNGYEAGMGASRVAQFWVCTWESAYLAAADANDTSAEKHALNEIDAFGTLPVTKRYFPDWNVEYSLYITPAKRGDWGPLRNDLGSGGCQ